MRPPCGIPEFGADLEDRVVEDVVLVVVRSSFKRPMRGVKRTIELVRNCSFRPDRFVPPPGHATVSRELTGSPWNFPFESCQNAAGPVGTLTSSPRQMCRPRGSPLAAPLIMKKSAFMAATGVPNSFDSAFT